MYIWPEAVWCYFTRTAHVHGLPNCLYVGMIRVRGNRYMYHFITFHCSLPLPEAVYCCFTTLFTTMFTVIVLVC